MLTKSIQNDELESIISQSAAPLENLSLAIYNIQEHVNYYQKLPTIAKPFLKRDLPSISNLDEQEWLDLLHKIKENFENIYSTASNMLGKSPSIAPEYKSMPTIEIFKMKKLQKLDSDLILSQRKKKTKSLSYDIFPSQENNVPEKATIYCPECGQECNGKRGLKTHIFADHNGIRKEMLKTFQL